MANTELDFLKSALTTNSSIFPNEKILIWIEERRKTTRATVEQIPLELMRKWHRDELTGNLNHESGRFFSIEGICVRTNWGQVPAWEQPIINQPEIGILGFVTNKFDGILHFLVQAKIEPGNINTVQISPRFKQPKVIILRYIKVIDPDILNFSTAKQKYIYF